jgi:3-deoxy-7-phosphoheptulonate synthase
MSLASVGAGANGLIIEVHNDPKHALCDGAQSLNPSQFDELMKKVKIMAPLVNKKLEG